MFNRGGYGYYSFMKLSLRTLLKCNQVNMFVHRTPHVYTASGKYSQLFIFTTFLYVTALFQN